MRKFVFVIHRYYFIFWNKKAVRKKKFEYIFIVSDHH